MISCDSAFFFILKETVITVISCILSIMPLRSWLAGSKSAHNGYFFRNLDEMTLAYFL